MRNKIIFTLIFLIAAITAAPAATQKVLYSFTGGVDGSGPYVGLVFDKAGNLYGVTEEGGLYGWGTVFQLRPSSSGDWTETVIHNFTGGTDGGVPNGILWFDDSGNLHGTAVFGGDPFVQCGTSFMMSPYNTGGWTFTVSHTYLGAPNDGCGPASDGSTTIGGGRSDDGVAWSDKGLMYSFGGLGGSQPWGSVRGWGFGTAYAGGAHGQGTVYALKSGHRRPAPMHAFTGGKDGGGPLGDLLFRYLEDEKLWVLYGTTSRGGTYNRGTVFQVKQSQLGGWLFSVLHAFSGNDGASPCAGLTADTAGNLYGTTAWGGANNGYSGTVFKMTPRLNKYGRTIWDMTTLYSFSGGTDGSDIYSPVVLDSAGNLYGTAYSGGAYGQGVVYEIIP